jgi:phospholipase C
MSHQRCLRSLLSFSIAVVCGTVLASCVGVVPSGQLTVSLAGTGSGTVMSSPGGINCGVTCNMTFPQGSSVSLTATPSSGSTFVGWSGACSGTTTCQVSVARSSSQSVVANFAGAVGVQKLQHIIFLVQENRSFDHYFGALREYWAANGFADQAFDGLPQFNIPAGATPTNASCDPTLPPPNDCTLDPSSPSVASFHLQTMCVENPSPSWNESHKDLNFLDPTSNIPALDGFVWTAAHDARNSTPPLVDVNGQRVMGFYDGNDLNYYYFMASNFATSDRWFSPTMSRTPPNRMYLIGATSGGHAYPITDPNQVLNSPIIFQELQQAGVTWKVYVHPDLTGCSTPACLFQQSSLQNFSYGRTILNQFPQNLATHDQFIADAQNGALPQVAYIEPAGAAGLDEHPADFDAIPPCCSIQAGSSYASTLINAVMNGPSWKDSAFILSFDEFGGFYDHVSPQPAVSPDGIKPIDLLPGDECTQTTGPTCDFTFTGYRVPLLVVSPFAKKHFVSHTVADYTAILKLMEVRFSLSPLSQRDSAQMDMSEFFDFNNPPWVTPPLPPVQNTTGACYLDHLP